MTSLSDRVLRWMPLTLVGVLLAWVAVHATRPLDDPDAWWHLRLGNDLIDQRSLGTPDHWSAFATVHWVPTEPVPEVVAAYVDRWWGLAGLNVLYAVAAMAVVLTLYLVSRRYAAPLPAVVSTIVAVLAVSASLTPRPQLVSFVLLPLVVSAWLSTEQDHRTRWWLVPLIYGWSLCHGFWFIGAAYGFLFVVGFALSRRMPLPVLLRQATVAIASVLVVGLNPVGLGVLEAPLAVRSTSKYIIEWQRTDLTTGAALSALAMAVAVAVAWGLTRPKPSWPRVLMLVSAVFWTWYAARTVALAGLVLAPLLAEVLDRLVRLDRQAAERMASPGRTRPEVALLTAAALVATAGVALVAPHRADRPDGVPLALDSALDRLPAGTRVFNSYELGGWIAWRHPDLEQYIDGLITPYSETHAQDYVTAESGSPGWQRVIARSRASVALLQVTQPLVPLLVEAGWVRQGTDSGYVLLTTGGSSR